jgi:hypothetical protein
MCDNLNQGIIKMRSLSSNNDNNVKEQLNELINQVSTLYSSKNIVVHYLDHFKRKAKLVKLDTAPETVKKVFYYMVSINTNFFFHYYHKFQFINFIG